MVSGLELSEMADALTALGVPAELQSDFWAVARENVETRGDVEKWWVLIRDGAEPLVDAEDSKFVATAMDMLPAQPWDETTWGAWTAAVKEATGRKGRGLFMPLRKALTGMDHGPDMSKLMPLLKR